MSERTGIAPVAEESLARQDALRALYELAVQGAGVGEPAEVSRLAVVRARDLLAADCAAIYTFEISSGLLRRQAMVGPALLRSSVTADEGAVGLAFRTGRPLTVDDYAAWRHAIPESARGGLGSVVAVPLVAEQTTVGVLAAGSRGPHGFDEADREVLAMLAALVATMLLTAQGAAEARGKARMFEVMHEVAVAAGGLLEPQALALLVAKRLAELLAAESVEVWWSEQGSASLARLAPDPTPPGRPARAARLAGRAFRTGRPALARPGGSGPVALALPLLAAGRARGALTVSRPGSPRFEPEDIKLLSLFAAQLAPALDAAHLAAESDWRARTFAALHELSVAAGGVLEPARLAALVVEKACELMSSESGGLLWWHQESGRLRVLADSYAGWSIPTSLPPNDGAAGRAFTTRQPVIVNDYMRLRRAYPPAIKAGIRSVAAVPLLVHDRAVGALTVNSRRAGHFHGDRMRVISLLAAQVAPALEAAELVAERERQARAQVALRELAVAAGGVLQPAELAGLVVERAAALIGFDRVALYWWDHGAGQLVALAASSPGGSPRLRRGQGAAGAAFEQVAPVLIEDYQNWEHSTAWARRRGFGSVMAVPLIVNDRAVGAVAAYSMRARSFSAEDTNLLSLLAAQVAPALEAARLHEGLARSEERFRSLYETLASGIVVINAKGLVTDANRAAEEIVGLRLNQMRGHGPRSLWQTQAEGGGGDRPQLAALEGGRPIRDIVVELTRRDGQQRWVQFDAVPVLGRDGKVEEVVSSLIDISARRQAEAALHASEGRFRTVFDRAAIGIIRLGLDGSLLEANPAMAGMLGLPSSRLVGRSVSGLLMADESEASSLTAFMRGAKAELLAELRWLRADGTPMWGRTTATLVRGERGEPVYAIAMVEDITEHKRQSEALAHQAMHDALTDLPNRTLLFDRLAQGIQLSQRGDEVLALLMVDLDHFKEVNDNFKSHRAGDMLLRDVATRLRGQVRASDTVARLGGDEFAIVLMSVDGEMGAAQAASKVLSGFDAPFHVDGRPIQIGASIGIALYPEHGEDADTLMRRADSAMYAAKRAGSGLAVYRSDDGGPAGDRYALAGDLATSLERGQLRVFFQPRIELGSMRVVGVEAVARWEHPDLGLLLPDYFLPIAEQSGIVVALERWVLTAALAQAGAWRKQGLDVMLAVNLSVQSFHQLDLPPFLVESLAETGVDAAAVQVEVSEAAVMSNPQKSLSALRSLAAVGLNTCIDQFGTGYSSLAYVRRLPIREVKVDGSLVADMGTDGDAAAMVRSTVELGRHLGLRIAFEGVDDRRTWLLAQDCGCDIVLGGLFGAPAEPDELARRLLRSSQAAPMPTA